ncbi:hypothetical protein ACL58G_10800 [Massilia sp. GER05]|uniref:hypothetical protein n=1 Tax=Massilia sp. GER05 TaxID=3394605 RepID=UPI003F870C00
MKRLGIFGTSGFAREIGDIAWELSYKPLYIAQNADELTLWNSSDEAIVESGVRKYADIPFAIGIGNQNVRQRLVRLYNDFTFANLIHPDATFGRAQKEAVLARRGIIVAAGVRLTNHIQIGNFVVLDRNSTVGHDCIIDDFVHIAPSACVSGNVHIGARCWIGAGAIINQGDVTAKLIIGNDTVIGSGSVVVRACEPQAVYVGIPAKRIK